MVEAKIIFNYNQGKIEIQCNENEIIKDILKKYANKIQKDLKLIYFLYSGKAFTEKEYNLPLKKVINSSDQNKGCLEILVYDNLEENNNNDILERANQLICPKCKEISTIQIENYKLKISCNKCGINKILISEFEKSQMIDSSKIVCNICKNTNKAGAYQKVFYKCFTCKNNICPLCKSNHDKKHTIVNYDDIYYFCEKHSGPYNSYCKTCKKNFCTDCEKEHGNHEIVTYGKIIPDKNGLKSNLEKQKKIIEDFNGEITKIINKLEKIRDNMNILFKTNENMINNYINLNTKRNCEMIININDFNSYINNNIIKDINQIISNKNESIKILGLLNIYDKMSSLEIVDDIDLEDKNKLKPLFTIRSSININKCISAKNSNYGENAVIWDYQLNNKNQIFELEKGTEEGYYCIKNHYSGYYLGLDIKEWKINFKKKKENAQNFKIMETKNGFYTIVEKSDHVLETGNWITDNGHALTPFPAGGNAAKIENSAQLWKFVLL